MEPVIRRALSQDAQGIIDAHARSIREVCAKDYTPEQIEAWAGRSFKTSSWIDTMRRDFVWVIEFKNQIHGYGHLAIMDQEVGEVMGLYFTPEVRGMGLGKKLLSSIKEMARVNGVKELDLHATITAKTFYEAQGFSQIPGDDGIEMRGVKIPCFPMKLNFDIHSLKP